MDIKELRKRYQEVVGKKAYYALTEEQLLQKIEESIGVSRNGTEVVTTGDVIEVDTTAAPFEIVQEAVSPNQPTPVIYNGDMPFVPQAGPAVITNYKTDKEVVRDMQVGIAKPVILAYSFSAKWEICDYLWKVLKDGAIRARINNIKPREDSKGDFVSDLQELIPLVKEGELKAEVQYFINLLINLK